MRLLNKIIFLISLLLSLTVAVACSQTNSRNGSEAASEVSSAAGVDSYEEMSLPSEDSVAPIDMEIILATAKGFPPFEYEESTEHPGLDIEIAEKIADYLGLSLKIQYMDYETVLSGISLGQYDIGMAAISPDKTKEALEFSNGYMSGSYSALITASSEISSKDDLNSATIGVVKAMPAETYCENEFKKTEVVSFGSVNEALSALKDNEIDCIVIDKLTASTYATTDSNLIALDIDSAEFSYVVAMAKGNAELLTDINEALLVLEEDGTIDELIKKYDPESTSNFN